MKLFVLGTRCESDIHFDMNPVFIGSSVKNCEEFIKNNQDFFLGYDIGINWIWTICIDYLDYDMFNNYDKEHDDNGIFKKYTKDGMEILNI
jgi:hypothetical protein